MFNLIAVCPICHAKVHYANTKEKGEIFSKMYELRKNEMQKHGFDLNKINEVFNKYYKQKNQNQKNQSQKLVKTSFYLLFNYDILIMGVKIL